MNLFLCTILQVGIGTYVTYLSGSHSVLTNPSRVCIVGSTSSYDDQISFGATFANIPQVMLFITYQEMARYNNDFTVTIHDPTTTSFYVSFQCFASYRQISNFIFSWVAIDDDRIKVINKQVSVSNQKITITETHGIKNAATGFVSILSVTFGGIQNYIINNLQIQGDQVSVDYSPTTNSLVTKIGFQLVVATNLLLTVIKDLQTGKITSSTAVSVSVTDISGSYFFAPFQGFYWLNTATFFNIILSKNSPLTKCTFSLVSSSTPELENLYYQKVWINTNKYSVPTTFLHKKMRITKKKYSNSYPVQLYIGELTQYFNPPTSYSTTLLPKIQTLNIVASFSCPQGYKLVGQVLTSILPTYRNLSTNCYKGINFVEYHIMLTQKDSVYQQIQISVTTTGITITELYGDPLPTISVTIMQLQLVII